MTNPDTYPAPANGWTCFHCGETFRTPGSARDHFGCTPASDLACRIKAGDERGLLMALRKAEAALTNIAHMGLGTFGNRPADVARRALGLDDEETP